MSRLIHSLTTKEIKNLISFIWISEWFWDSIPKIEYKNASDGMSESILETTNTKREEYQYIKVYHWVNKKHYIAIWQNWYISRPKMGYHINSREDDPDTELLSEQQKSLAKYWFLNNWFDIFLYDNNSKKIKKLIFTDL